jgi:hypothetical protein
MWGGGTVRALLTLAAATTPPEPSARGHPPTPTAEMRCRSVFDVYTAVSLFTSFFYRHDIVGTCVAHDDTHPPRQTLVSPCYSSRCCSVKS